MGFASRNRSCTRGQRRKIPDRAPSTRRTSSGVRRLRFEPLEDRRLLSAVTFQWQSRAVYLLSQAQKPAPLIVGQIRSAPSAAPVVAAVGPTMHVTTVQPPVQQAVPADPVHSASTLFSFDNGAPSGAGEFPLGSLTLSGSTLYGMTSTGGAHGDGTIFSVPVSGGPPTILYSFDNGAHSGSGAFPFGSLTLSGSTLYGMTAAGGADGDGTVFSIPVTGGTPTILFSFDGGVPSGSGKAPLGSLTLGGSTLYGMTSRGGADGDGTIFSLPTSGGTPTILYSFDNAHGAAPAGSLTLAGSLLFGMTEFGGIHGDGAIFTVPASGGTLVDLYSFDNTHGEFPVGSLTLSGSVLYGTTLAGGASGQGTVFRISTLGGLPTVLYSFDNGPRSGAGEAPAGDLTLSGSTLYGTTLVGGANGDGTVFSISTGGGSPTILYSFDNGAPAGSGEAPRGSLTLGDSVLYGTTVAGGANGLGTLFALSAPVQPAANVVAGSTIGQAGTPSNFALSAPIKEAGFTSQTISQAGALSNFTFSAPVKEAGFASQTISQAGALSNFTFSAPIQPASGTAPAGSTISPFGSLLNSDAIDGFFAIFGSTAVI